ncbi:MAG: chaperone modulator CbpM [Bacteroidales bacterium]|nr:chaperone modulator CbpM [Bacteroidales bacterium]
MRYNIIRVYQGPVMEEEDALTLFQLCKLCRSNPELIIAMVNEGILDPIGESKSQWRFSFSTVENVRKVVRFQNDLNVNLAGAALALQLLDRIEELESMVERI